MRSFIFIIISLLLTNCSFNKANSSIDKLLNKNEIELGMSQEELRDIMGKPKKIISDKDGVSKFYYGTKIAVFQDNQLVAIHSEEKAKEEKSLSPEEIANITYLCDRYNEYGNFPSGGGCNKHGCWGPEGNCNTYGCSKSKVVCTKDGCHTPIKSVICTYGSYTKIR